MKLGLGAEAFFLILEGNTAPKQTNLLCIMGHGFLRFFVGLLKSSQVQLYWQMLLIIYIHPDIF